MKPGVAIMGSWRWGMEEERGGEWTVKLRLDDTLWVPVQLRSGEGGAGGWWWGKRKGNWLEGVRGVQGFGFSGRPTSR